MNTLSTQLTRQNYEFLFQEHTSLTLRRNGIPNSAKLKKQIDTMLDEMYDLISSGEYKAFHKRDEISALSRANNY